MSSRTLGKPAKIEGTIYFERENQTRISPQLSCTISPEDKEMLNELTLFLSAKAGRPLNVSSVVRALIRLGAKRKVELDV